MVDETNVEGDGSGTMDADDIPYTVGYIRNKFTEAENGRRESELRWQKAYKNYRGIIDGTTAYTATEKSKVFVKITKVKVLAAYGQIIDILFSNKKFPLVVESTPVPEGIAEFAHLSQNPIDQKKEEPNDFLAGLEEKYGKAPSLKEGPSSMGEPQISPSRESAYKLDKVIQDQLVDADAVKILRHAIFECCLLGSGIIKGPFSSFKEVQAWEVSPEGKRSYSPYQKNTPIISAVSCWDFYPDPAATSIEDCDYVIERHKMNREQLRSLRNKPYFDLEAIDTCLDMGPNYVERGYESSIRDEDDFDNAHKSRYEVLEYWGYLDKSLSEQLGLELPEGQDHLDSLHTNIWICGNTILRAVVNPFTPARIPYQSVPYETNPYNFFGIGVAENMEDAQMLMNGHMRMAIDNLVLAGNMVFDIDETALVPGQSMEIYPGKIFRRQSGATGQAVNGVKFPNTANENIQMYQVSRQLADEETGIPSIIHGQTGVTGAGRTAAGLSMLMSSAGLSIKTAIKNIDDYLLKPMGEGYFQWNMQFNEEHTDIVGDLEIKPKGTAAVMQKEIRSQRLLTLLQTVANPALAPFIKIPNLIKELAIAQDIDPELLVNDVNEAAVFADILRGLTNAQGTGPQAGATNQPQEGMGGAGAPPVGANAMDSSGVGGGNIGVGNAPIAGESGFTGNPPQS
tara:strand:+ start:3644 stop:5689 length:2046 start_codon:yes stop_codon:yes gene_type:complete